MKNSIIPLVLSVAVSNPIASQNSELKSYPIDNTGYSVLFPVNPGKAEISLSNNELTVYTMEVASDGKRYGMQLVLLEENFMYSEKETLENLLMQYMQLLKLSYDVTSGIGYIKEQKHKTNTDATGILDFWEDEQGAQWAVKGWVDNHALVVLYVHTRSASEMLVPYDFLDGFTFKKKIKGKNPPLYYSERANLK